MKREHLDELLTPEEAADFLRMSAKTLAKWRCIRRGPNYVKIGRRVAYRPSDLASFADAGFVDVREAS